MKKTTAIIFSLCAIAFAATAEDSNLLKNGDFSRGKTNWITAGTVAEEGNAGVLTLNAKANRANHLPLIHRQKHVPAFIVGRRKIPRRFGVGIQNLARPFP